jgi:hypothetical protein
MASEVITYALFVKEVPMTFPVPVTQGLRKPSLGAQGCEVEK